MNAMGKTIGGVKNLAMVSLPFPGWVPDLVHSPASGGPRSHNRRQLSMNARQRCG
jgi:hypothetical protein